MAGPKSDAGAESPGAAGHSDNNTAATADAPVDTPAPTADAPDSQAQNADDGGAQDPPSPGAPSVPPPPDPTLPEDHPSQQDDTQPADDTRLRKRIICCCDGTWMNR
jgi:hypothetical protein